MPGHYDKILRENIESVIPFIIEQLLGIDYDETRVIKDKIQVTVERETDYICIVVKSSGKYILHLEFQSESAPDMAARMLLYKAILFEKYGLQVRQFVIYLGKSKKPQIPETLQMEGLSFSYTLIRIRDIPTQTFLESSIPEGVILAVLGASGELPAKEIIQKILSRLRELAPEKNRLQKYTTQLRILSQLRNLQSETNHQINLMALNIDIRKDPVYQKGIEKGKTEGIAEGIEEKSRQFVINLLKNTDFDDEKIAMLAAVTPAFVREIRKEIEK